MRVAVSLFVLLGVMALIGWWIGPYFLREDGDMAEPRSEVHAAELDGKIYVAGGIGFFRTLKSCAVFDTINEAFSDCPDLPRNLHHVAMAAGRGEVFASGGYSSLPFVADADAALFAHDPSDTASGWRIVSPLPHPLGQHAMVFHDGAVWLVGGETGGSSIASLWRYDLDTGTWDERSAMPTPRHSHAVAVDNGRLFVTGGRSAILGSASTVVEAYTFATDEWEVLPEAPFALGGHGAAVYAGRLHVFGGEELSNGIVVADHASLDLAQPEAGWRDGIPVAQPRHGFATAVVGDSAWIIAGGKRAGWRTLWSVTGGAQPLSLAE